MTSQTSSKQALEPTNSFPPALRLIVLVFLIYSGTTWLSSFVHHWLGHSLPYSSPFIHKNWDPFTDFRTYYMRTKCCYHTEHFFEQSSDFRLPYFSYPAAGSVVYWFFYLFPHFQICYLLMEFAWTALLTWLLWKTFLRHGLAPRLAAGLSLGTLVTCFPLEFLIERGNIEVVVWMLIFTGLYLYLKGREIPAAILFGVATSIKIFPLIFCGILLYRRRWRTLAIAVLAAAISNLMALWFAGPTIAIAFRGFNQTVSNYQSAYSIPARAADVGMDHSFYALIKVLGESAGLHYQGWLHPYYAVAGLVALALFFGRSLRLPLANQILFIMVMAVSLPPNSFDYTLVYLYAPWTILCLAAFTAHRRGQVVHGLNAMLALFIPLFAPFSLFVVHDVRFGGQVQACFLLVLLGCCLTYPIDNALWRRDPRQEDVAPERSVWSPAQAH